MTATWLNGKGSRWTVMGEHLKQVHLWTTTDYEKSCSVSQPKIKKGTTFIFRPTNHRMAFIEPFCLFCVFFPMRYINQELFVFFKQICLVQFGLILLGSLSEISYGESGFTFLIP